MKKYLSLYLLTIFLTAPLFFSACTPEESDSTYTPTPPEWSYSATIYEVNVRQFSEEGTFEKVEAALPRLKEMGVKIIWLMPIHPIGEVERKGSLGSYYSVKDYFGINPEFGTEDDFRSLVNTAHALDLKVIIDWVANHTAWDSELTTTNPEFYELNEEGNFIPPRGTDWSDVIQLDFENPELWDYMVSALKYWVEEFNIDGYRCDVADMVPADFWSRARMELDEIKPVFMLAEAEKPYLHPAFDMSYGWNMHHAYNAVAQGREPISKIDELRESIKEEFPENAFMMNFTSNHDENTWNGTVFERMGDGAKAFAVLSVTQEGMPLLYNGQESGMSKRLEFFEKDPIEWDYDSPFMDFYTRLFNLKREHPALQNGDRGGDMRRITTSADEAIYAFERTTGESSVLVMLNLTDEPVIFSSSDLPEGVFTELFSVETIEPSITTEFEFEPWQYTVLIK